MEIVALSKYVRVSPRKVKLVADAVVDEKLDKILTILKFMKKAGARPLLKTINSAVENAVNNFNLKKEELSLKSIQILKGPIFKRWRAVSRGRAHPYLKRTSHIKVVLEETKKKKLGGERGTKNKS